MKKTLIVQLEQYKELWRYIIAQLALKYRPIRAIYKDITANDFEKRVGIPRLNPKQIGKESFANAIGGWLQKKDNADLVNRAHLEWQRHFDTVKWASAKQRVVGLSHLLEKLIEDCHTQDDVIVIRKNVFRIVTLMEQIRRERQLEQDRAALKESGRLSISPSTVNLDQDLIKEIILVLRTDIGGLHSLVDSLTVQELNILIDAADESRKRKLSKTVDAEYEIIENKDKHDEEN